MRMVAWARRKVRDWLLAEDQEMVESPTYFQEDNNIIECVVGVQKGEPVMKKLKAVTTQFPFLVCEYADGTDGMRLVTRQMTLDQDRWDVLYQRLSQASPGTP